MAKNKANNLKDKVGNVLSDENMDKNSSLIGIVAISVIVFALGLVISRSLVGDILFNSKVSSAQAEAKENAKENVEIAESLQQNYETLNEDGITEELVLEALPADFDKTKLAVTVDSMRLLSGVTINSISFDEAQVDSSDSTSKSESEVIPIEFEVSIAGSYINFLNFLVATENSVRPFVINELSIEGEAGEIEANVTLTSYYQPAITAEPREETISE